MANAKRTAKAGSTAGTVATIGVTVTSISLMLGGVAVGLSCERWATGPGQCDEAWLGGLSSAGGGGLGLIGTWLRNPYIRREEEGIPPVEPAAAVLAADPPPPPEPPGPVEAPVEPDPPADLEPAALDFYVPEVGDTGPDSDTLALMDALREDMNEIHGTLAAGLADVMAEMKKLEKPPARRRSERKATAPAE